MSNDQVGPLATLLGAGAIANGQNILYSHPAGKSDYILSLTQSGDVPTMNKHFEARFGNAGVGIRLGSNHVPPLIDPGSPYYSTNRISNPGNSATLAEAKRIAAAHGLSLDDIGMDLRGVKDRSLNAHVFEDGTKFYPDLKYRTYSFLNGATDHFDESKAQKYILDSLGNRRQLAWYGRAAAETNARNAGIRALGKGLRGAGGILTGANILWDAYHALSTGDPSRLADDALNTGAYAFGGPIGAGVLLAGQTALSSSPAAAPTLDDANNARWSQPEEYLPGDILASVPSDALPIPDPSSGGLIEMPPRSEFYVNPFDGFVAGSMPVGPLASLLSSGRPMVGRRAIDDMLSE